MTFVYKRYLFRLLALIVLLLCGIVTFNYFSDPYKEFFLAQNYANKVADVLLDKKNVLLYTNGNDRLLQKTMLEKLSEPIDMLVLGSSRTMPITHNMFGAKTLFNASVSRATLEDEIMLFYVYQKHYGNPKIVFIGLDPWCLEKNNSVDQWSTAISAEYQSAKKQFNITAETPYMHLYIHNVYIKVQRLLAFDFFQTTLERNNFMRKVLGVKPVFDFRVSSDSQTCPMCYLKLTNGAHLPSSQEETTNSTEADAKGLAQAEEDLSVYQKFTELDGEAKATLDSFIHYLVQQKIKIVFYLPPFEPKTFEQYSTHANFKMIHTAENFYHSLADKYGVSVIGSYNPQKLNLTALDFFDAMHLKKKSIDLLLDQYTV